MAQLQRAKTLTRRIAALLTSAAFLASTLLPAGAQSASLPNGGNVVSGSASISAPNGTSLLVTQSSKNAIINWGSFSIGSGNSAHFSNGSGATLNRVTGLSPSQIDGSLTATGSLYLVNPNGVAVGSSGKILTGGSFIASTLDVSDAEFNAGADMTFRGNSHAAVVNYGSVGALGGDVALIARRVENAGALDAPNGTAALTAGYEVLMRDASLSDGKFVVKVGGADTEAKTSGSIRAAEVELRANGGNVYALAGNTKGQIKATGVAKKGGRIFLTAGDGEVKVEQKLVARGTPTTKGRRQGGEIRVAGKRVDISGKLDARGQKAKGGTILVTARDIVLNSGASLDVSGASGGILLVGGDYQGGQDPTRSFASETVPNAETVTVEAGATLRADGSAGSGGNIAVWSDAVTHFGGAISATGAGVDGNGGFAEVSGKRLLDYAGTADLRGQNGHFGTLLLDPYDLTISSAASSGVTGFTASGNDSVLNAATLQNALATANVMVTTGGAGSPGTQAGDITVASNVAWSSGSTLTLSAYRDITVNDGVTISNSGAGSIVLRADNSGTGTGMVNLLGTTGARLSDSGGGGVQIFYNPTGGYGGTNASTISGNPYAARVALSGESTLTASMLVNDVNQLQAINGSNVSLSGIYALGRDIDASATATWNGGAGFVPIGTNGAGTVLNGGIGFTGALGGEGYVIDGLSINRQNATMVGLFGRTRNAELENIGLTNANIRGGGAVGGLAGYVEVDGGSTVIKGSYVSGLVDGQSDVGGLIGAVVVHNVSLLNISQSYTNTVVTGSSNVVGGLVGRIETYQDSESSIEQSYSAGLVSGDGYSGGLVGQSNVNGGGSTFKITQSYADVDVKGKDSQGGLIGYTYAENGGGGVFHSPMQPDRWRGRAGSEG